MMYVLVLLFIIIIFYINLNYVLPQENFKEKQSYCILLTTCVNLTFKQTDVLNNRKNHYISIINKYLDNTKFDINIVESSGYSFDEFKNNPRINVYTFVNKEEGTPSYLEALSILKAYYNMGLHKYDFLIKITGKYYIPNLENIINDLENKQLYFPNISGSSFYKNSEIFGCKTKYIPKIMNKIIKNSKYNLNFELTISLYSLFNDYGIFSKIYLNEPIKRGDGSILTAL